MRTADVMARPPGTRLAASARIIDGQHDQSVDTELVVESIEPGHAVFSSTLRRTGQRSPASPTRELSVLFEFAMGAAVQSMLSRDRDYTIVQFGYHLRYAEASAAGRVECRASARHGDSCGVLCDAVVVDARGQVRARATMTARTGSRGGMSALRDGPRS